VKIGRLITESSTVAARTTSMQGAAGPWASKPTGRSATIRGPSATIAITSIGTGTARIAVI
jgi:hypothetical protein